jgi:hypothetical protein
MLARKFRILAALPVLALLVQGCTNAEGKYNDFIDRQKALQEGGAGGSDAGFTPCDPPKPGDIDGQYLFALSAKIGTLQPPVLFLADMTTVANQGGTALKMTLHSLSASDRKTEVGSPLDIPEIGIGSDGVIDNTALPEFTVTGVANPIQPGQDIVASGVRLVGQICGTQDFYCGTVTGNVTKPTVLNLVGSPYTFEVVTDPNSLPLDPLYVNCAKDTAPPLK